MFFEDLLNQCREQVCSRIRDGQTTERGLARRAGISQPYLHKILKGVRPMSADLADRLMRQLGMTLAELIPRAAGGPQSGNTASR